MGSIIFLIILFLLVMMFRTPKGYPSGEAIELIGDGSFSFEIVGESNYQKNIMKALNLSGGRSSKSFEVRLVHDDLNKYDDKAVAVFIDDYLVGYLPKQKARGHRKRMDSIGHKGKDASCSGTVWGGGSKKNYGIFLDYNTSKTTKHYKK